MTGAAAAAEEPGWVVGLQRRVGGAAAAVLGAGRTHPDAATILRCVPLNAWGGGSTAE